MSSSQIFFDQEKNKVIEIGRQRDTCSCFSQDKRNAALVCRRQFPAGNLSWPWPWETLTSLPIWALGKTERRTVATQQESLFRNFKLAAEVDECKVYLIGTENIQDYRANGGEILKDLKPIIIQVGRNWFNNLFITVMSSPWFVGMNSIYHVILFI